MIATNHKPKDLTASHITEMALRQLLLAGYEVWRNNNLAVRGRKFIGKRGASDIIGYTTKGILGRFVACEVKTRTDKLSDAQIEFLTDVKNAGGIALIARQSEKGNVEIIEFF